MCKSRPKGLQTIPQLRLLFLFPLLVLFCAGAHAQWFNYPTPGTPRTPDGKPNLAAPVPLAANGKPDLSGVWHVHPTSLEEMRRLFGKDVGAVNPPGMEVDTMSKYARNIFVDILPEDAPMRAEAAGIFRRRAAGHELRGLCVPAGIPLDGLLTDPNKIIQSPSLIVIMYESNGTHRQIYTDGRVLPAEVAQPSWLGYSVGKWEGDTLVVESAGFNDRTWLDLIGHPHSEGLHITERYHRRDFGHLDVEMTFDDPHMYTKPFSIQFTQDLWPESDIFENICENEKDRAHLLPK